MPPEPTAVKVPCTPCANCDGPLQCDADYCPACGQRVLGPEARTFRHLLRASVAEASSLDGRLWRSIGRLLFAPGLLSREYRLGRRQRYLSPIALFLLGNLLFFLAPSLSDFTLALEDQYRLQPYSGWVAPWIDATVAGGAAFESLAEAYALRVNELAKTLVILHVPLLALASLPLARRRSTVYADHVVMALHFFAFLMIYTTVVPLALGPLLRLEPLVPLAPYVGPSTLLPPLLYALVMLRTALGLGWLRALLSTVPFLIGLLMAHFMYRLVQFLIAFGSIVI